MRRLELRKAKILAYVALDLPLNPELGRQVDRMLVMWPSWAKAISGGS